MYVCIRKNIHFDSIKPKINKNSISTYDLFIYFSSIFGASINIIFTMNITIEKISYLVFIHERSLFTSVDYFGNFIDCHRKLHRKLQRLPIMKSIA